MEIKSVEQLQQAVQGFRAARIIQTACGLRLFDYTRTPATLEEIVEKSGMSFRGIHILLHALVSLGLMEKRDGMFHNASLADQFLTSDSDPMMLTGIEHAEKLYMRWGYLRQCVATGKPWVNPEGHLDSDPEINRQFIHAMHAYSSRRVTPIVEALPVKRLNKVIDIGGGAGTFLLALLKKFPFMHGTLVDQRLTLNTAREIIAKAGYSKKISLRELDIFDTNRHFGTHFDLAIVSNIIHIESPEKNIDLFKRIKACLTPQGRLLLVDFLLDGTLTKPQFAAFFAVNMLTATERGRTWPADAVRNWLKAGGFTGIMPLDVEIDADVWICW